jgi:hypothetical protein
LIPRRGIRRDDRAIGEPAVELQGGLARPIKQGLGGPAQSAKCSVDALLQRQFAFVVNALVFRGVEDQSKEMKVKGVRSTG